jgi:hypothetical protein
MAIFKNTAPIVTDGLVGYFDTLNSLSYASGSLVWKDLTSNGDIILTGSGGMLPIYWVGDREIIPSIATLPYNAYPFSNDFASSAWSKTTTSYTSTVTGSAIAPPPTLMGSGSKLNETEINSKHALRRGINLAIGEAMTFSFYAKAAERNWVYWENSDWSGGAVSFNLSNGQIGTITNGGVANGINMTPFSASMENVGDGWYRCSLMCRTGYDSISTTIGVAQSDSIRSYVGDVNSGIYVYGAQVEYGTQLKTYIDQPNVISSYNNNGYLEYNTPYIQENNVFSLFVWARGLINSGFGTFNIFSKYIPTSDTSGNGINFSVRSDALYQSTNTGILRSVNLFNIFAQSRPLTAHGWFQVGLVRTATQTIYYWNGIRVGINNKDVSTVTNATVKFGAGNGSGPNSTWYSYPGLAFGNILAYNRVLSDSEIVNNYNSMKLRYRSTSPTNQFGIR